MEFTTAKKTDRAEVTFDLDGVTLTAREPKKASVIDLASVATLDDPVRVVDAARAFVEGWLVPESRDYVRDRLDDPDDDFDLPDLVPILKWATEQLSARPTQPPQPSRAQRRSPGTSSTARSRSRASTPRASASVGS